MIMCYNNFTIKYIGEFFFSYKGNRIDDFAISQFCHTEKFRYIEILAYRNQQRHLRYVAVPNIYTTKMQILVRPCVEVLIVYRNLPSVIFGYVLCLFCLNIHKLHNRDTFNPRLLFFDFDGLLFLIRCFFLLLKRHQKRTFHFLFQFCVGFWCYFFSRDFCERHILFRNVCGRSRCGEDRRSYINIQKDCLNLRLRASHVQPHPVS